MRPTYSGRDAPSAEWVAQIWIKNESCPCYCCCGCFGCCCCCWKFSLVYCSSLPSCVFYLAGRFCTFAPIIFSGSTAIWMGLRMAFPFVAVIHGSFLNIIRLDRPIVQLCFGYEIAIAVVVATSIAVVVVTDIAVVVANKIPWFECGLWMARANGERVCGNTTEIIQ